DHIVCLTPLTHQSTLFPYTTLFRSLWMVLLSLVVFDCVRSQRRINARQGEIRLLMDGRLRWQGQEWCIVKAPWMIKSGMMLRLRSEEHTSELQSRFDLVCRRVLEKK